MSTAARPAPDSQAAAVAPILVFGWGNPSRGDDALGPLFVAGLRERLQARHPTWVSEVEWLDDFQLQVEHALDLVGRRQVLFVDAGMGGDAPFQVHPIVAARDTSFSSHVMSPQAVLQVLLDLDVGAPPACTLLEIRGERFDLGLPVSPAATDHLEQALQWGEQWAEGSLLSVPAGMA